jgi:peptidoglycan/xylan/chitin deacetylase (PgdA/CDA1 family)
MAVDAPFALCLTHDVDRPHKRLAHHLYYLARDRRRTHLRDLFSDREPYFRFRDVMAIEEELGVRSAFYFLNEPPLRDRPPRTWLRPRTVIEQLGRYDPTADRIADAIAELDAGGWEVGLHGSLASAGDRERLAHEKAVLEDLVEQSVQGCRQHRLRLEVPRTWRQQAAVGLEYDTSYGSSTTYGFHDGYGVKRPFDDEFAVFPLTAMEVALPDPGERFGDAWDACDRLLSEAAANGAVMTVLWHLRYFDEVEFPGYRRLYRRLVEAALDRGAWVGAPAELYERLEAGGAALRQRRPSSTRGGSGCR